MLEMAGHMYNARISRELNHAVPVASDFTFTPGNQVLVLREKVVNNRIGEWIRLYVVSNFYAENRLELVIYGK